MLQTTLYFGTQSFIDGRIVVTEELWRAFLDETVTPAFPDGLTWWRGNGQWRDPSGRLHREGCFVLVVLSDNPGLSAITAKYCEAFEQNSVLRITQDVGYALQG